MPAIDGTSVNVGRIGGGEGINVRAREAWFELDLRADDPADARRARARRRRHRSTTVDEPLRVERTVLGDRPAGRLDPSHPAGPRGERRAREAGIEVRPVATSTDANAAHARGIPADRARYHDGLGRAHAAGWIDTAPIADGVRALARTVARFEERSA